MASNNFSLFCRNLAKGNVDFDTATLKTILVSAVPSESNLDTWEVLGDVTTQITGTGYTAGGVAQAYTLDAFDTTNNRQPITLTNLAPGWTSATISAVGAIVYIDGATDYLIGFVDFGGTVSVTGGSFNITYTSPLYIGR
jgi:hypothetical protein